MPNTTVRAKARALSNATPAQDFILDKLADEKRRLKTARTKDADRALTRIAERFIEAEVAVEYMGGSDRTLSAVTSMLPTHPSFAPWWKSHVMGSAPTPGCQKMVPCSMSL